MPRLSDIVLAHYGVKGMKWGVTRDQAVLDRLTGRRTSASGGTRAERKKLNKQRDQDWKEYKKSTTRKERREDRKAALSSKAEHILSEATGKNTLVAINTPSSPTYKTVVTGKEFIDYISRGGSFDVRTADLFYTDED